MPHSGYRILNLIQMCRIIVSTEKFTGCSVACNITHRIVIFCNIAKGKNPPTMCVHATIEYMGRSTVQEQCPSHKA